MLEKMKTLLQGNDSCVLATCSSDQPHCSLMTYLADIEPQTVYVVTRNTGRKYANMMANPNVSLLIDTRSKADARSGEPIKALTLHGRCRPVDHEETRRLLLEEFIQKRPGIASLALDPQAVVFSVKITSYLLLDGVEDAYYETVE